MPRNNTYIVNAKWPKKKIINHSLISEFKIFQEIVMNVRNLRKEKNISNKVLLELQIKINNHWSNNFDSF